MTEGISQIAVIGFSLIFFLCGIYRRKGSKKIVDLTDFSIGSGNRGAFSIAAGISMTFVGGAATLNMASLGYQYGWSVLVDPISVAIALGITMVLVGRIRAGRGITISGILSQSSRPMQIFLGLISFAIYQMLTAAQFVAVGKLLAPQFPGISPSLIIFASVTLVFIYVYYRGFDAVTDTDVIQLIMILSLFAIPALYIFGSTPAPEELSLHKSGTAPLNLLIYLALPLLFVPVSHDTNIRAKASKSSGAARVGFGFGAGLYMLLVGISIGIGVFLRSHDVVLQNPESALATFFKENMGMLGTLSTIAVLAAILSTLDSFGFDAVISVANDVVKPLWRDKISDRRAILISVIGVFFSGLVIALYYQQILALILAGMLLYVSIFIPVSIGRLIRSSDPQLLTTSCITSLVLIICKIINYTPPLEPIAFLALHLILIAIIKMVRK